MSIHAHARIHTQNTGITSAVNRKCGCWESHLNLYFPHRWTLSGHPKLAPHCLLSTPLHHHKLRSREVLHSSLRFKQCLSHVKLAATKGEDTTMGKHPLSQNSAQSRKPTNPGKRGRALSGARCLLPVSALHSHFGWVPNFSPPRMAG